MGDKLLKNLLLNFKTKGPVKWIFSTPEMKSKILFNRGIFNFPCSSCILYYFASFRKAKM